MTNKGIPRDTFKNQASIASAIFGSQCTYIGENAFEGCSTLNEINDDNVIETIMDAAFTITALTSVNFSKLNSMGDFVFDGCSNLNKVNIPNLKNISNGAFKDCSSLEEIIISPNFEKVGDYSFYNCRNLNFENLNFENCTNIGECAFYNCDKLSQISLPICKKIGSKAFNDCTNLSKVYINNPNDFCELINIDAFSNTHEDITFYFRPEILESYYFDNIWSYFKEKMKYIQQNNQIIYTTSDKEPIKITQTPSSSNQIKEINYNEEFKKLEDIPILLNSGWVTFYNKVKNLDLDIFNINDKSRGKITYIQIPPECESIGEYVFKNCEKLELFEIPESITILGEGAFAGCKGISNFSGNKKFIENGDYVKYNNTLICVLPKKVNKIYNKIPNYIDRLGNSCFHGCESMKCIDIPNTIKEIGANVFEGCKNLRVIHFNSNTPPDLDGKLFGEDEKLVPDTNDFIIFVPNGSGDAYKAAYVDYADYIYEISNGDEANDDEAFVTSDGNVIKVKITQEGEEKDIFGVKLS